MESKLVGRIVGAGVGGEYLTAGGTGVGELGD